MHPTLFGLKRVHLLSVRMQEEHLARERVALTPARLDLLRIVMARGGSAQRWQLVKSLGVSGPVVSRMLRSLEALGFIERKRVSYDKRYVEVVITDAGFDLVDRALLMVVQDVALDHVVDACFGEKPEHHELFDRYVTHARMVLGETTPYVHPWRWAPLYDNSGKWFELPPQLRPDGPLGLRNPKIWWPRMEVAAGLPRERRIDRPARTPIVEPS